MHILLQVKLLWNKINAYVSFRKSDAERRRKWLPQKNQKRSKRNRREVKKSRTENRKIQKTASTIENGSSIAKANKILREALHTSLRRTLVFQTAVAEEVHTKYKKSKRESQTSHCSSNHQQNPEEVQTAEIGTGCTWNFKEKMEEPGK